MAEEVKYNNTLVSGRADETLTYTKYVKDESSGKSTKELIDEKVNKTDQLGTTQIADKAVTTEKLENESVTTDKLDSASVTTDKVADANITTSKLADSSVETEKINNKAVTTDKLNDGAVDNTKLSPNAVTSDKIKDESVITEKLNDRAVTTEKVEERAITNPKLGNQSVDGRVVREASLETKHFANGSVTTEKIKDGSVTNEKVADDTLGIEKFDPELRKTIQAATGLPEDLSQMIQNVDKSIKQLHEKDTDLQSNVEANQQQITANKSAQDAKNASLDENMVKLNTRDDQITETLKNISATGGASVASAVTYDNTTSQLTSANIQGAVDELQGAKIDKASILQESGEAEDKVMSQKAVSAKLSDILLKFPVVSLFDYRNVAVGKSINPLDGTISDVIKNYKLVKLHLLAGKYWIYSGCGSSSQATLWKYSDNGYASPEKEIVGSTGTTPYNQILTLDEGYYAFCWNDNNGNGFSLGKAFITDSMSVQTLINDSIKKDTQDIRDSLNVIESTPIPTVMSLFSKNDISLGKYIKGNEGTISNAIKSYKLVKLHLKSGKYWVYINNANSTQDILWKYSNETYEEPEQKIIGSAPSSIINKVVTLEEGYYAFCWNDGSSDSILPNRAFFTDNISTQMLIDESSTNIKNELKQEINSSEKSYGNLISDFSDFDILNNAFSISEDKASAQSLLTGYENRLQYNTNLYEDKFSLSSTLKIIDMDSLGYFEFCIGFWYQLAGTMFGIGKDENGSYISVYIVEQTLPPKQTHKYYISELAFAKGKEYTISIEKKTEKNSYFNISVTAQDGISASKEGIGNGEVISGDTANEGNGSINGYAWGKLSFYALIGKMRVSNVCFGYPIDMNDVKLVIVGHSFIEGNSIPSDKDKRFASLLCSLIGDRKTIILGQGGASVNSIKPHIDKEMKWLKDARYVLFCIGTNDIDSQATCTGLQYIDDTATKNGIKTIWLTVPPKYGTGDNHPVVNDYIRSHFHYVEIKDVFYNNDSVLDKNMFLSDNIHPSIEGHKRIYNLIKARCSFLKTI